MKRNAFFLAAGILVCAALRASATTRYVNLNNLVPAPPYTSWPDAATNIQHAIDEAVDGDEIIVTNGLYATGGRAVYGTMTNRVVIDKSVTVRSVNGPLLTVIEGLAVAGTTNGYGAIRCVYVGTNAVLSGFTLTNGHTRTAGDYNKERSGGGAWCEWSGVVSNCTLSGNSASGSGGGAYSGTLNNCTLSGNSASYGGGAYGGTLNHCTLSGNSARYGGGAYWSTLNNCTLSGNSASDYGGGAYDGTLNNCTLSGNSASSSGGGAYLGILNNCTLSGNSAYWGGGAYLGILNNCTLSGNSAHGGGGACEGTLNNCTLSGNSASYGGGASGGTLNNCTLSGNSASSGGGAYYGTLNNCIVYYNSALQGPNYYSGTFNYSCTTPLPPGLGNMEAEPLLASTSHLSAQSPCIGAGSSAYSAGVDIDGESWLAPPCVGADQFVGGQVTGGLTVGITAAYTNVGAGFGVAFVGENSGRVSASAWDFGDGVVVSNRPCASHAWAAPGLYEVRLTGYNDSNPGGVSASVWVRVGAREVYYVNGASAAPAYPYTNWVSAATNIQEAIDAGEQIGRLVLVADGVYGSGGRAVYGQMTNRVVVAEGVEVRSLNGPLLTVIEGSAGAGGWMGNGDGAIRCVYVGPNTVLSGFTLTNGHTRTAGDYYKEQCGGGAWCETSGVVSNCTLSGNSADYYGGGAYGGTLNNCTLSGNSTSQYGGGAYGGTLNNCTLSGNSARYGGGAFYGTLNNCTLSGNSASYYGGGAYDGTLNNCIVYYNSAPKGPNHLYCTLNYSCTTPLPPGPGNIEAEPRLASTSHLSAQSPCVGAGSSAYSVGVDIDGESWLAPPCMGADQFVGGQVTGELTMAITTACTNVSTGFEVAFVGENSGRVSASAWDFGDGVVVSNRPYASHAWAVPGLYEVRLTGYNDSYPGGVSASVWVQVEAREVYYVNGANAAPSYPYTNWVSAATNIQAAIDAGEQLGRLVLVAEGVYGSGGRPVYGQMTNRVVVPEGVEVRSVNGPLLTVIEGRAVAGTTNGNGAIRCVYVGHNAVLSGFTLTNGHTRTDGDSWKEGSGGGAWCEPSGVVSNCTLTGNSAYEYGGGAYYGTLNNCTLTGNSASGGGGAYESTLNNCTLSGNWARYDGGGAYESTLNNCTLSGNSASGNGGGAYYGTLNNCTLSGNSAFDGGGASYAALNNCTLSGNSASGGGGACGGTLNNCTLSGNSASGDGGGASGGTLNNCTLSGNSASYSAGGAWWGTLNNCIVYYNWAPKGPNYQGGTFNYSCTTPLPAGTDHFTNAPRFVNTNGWSNLRLQTNSPCINAGNNAYAPGLTDLDGLPRIAGGRVDIGAYEFQGAGLSGFTAWLWQYGLRTDGSSDYADTDTDGHNNWQEWRCQTNPTNALSALRLLSALPAGTDVTVTWESVAGVSYYLLRSTNLWAWPLFALVATNLAGQAGTTTYTDTNAASLAPLYYRVGVGDYVAPGPPLTWSFNATARTLQLSWSATGFRLQAQTNSLGVGLSANWFDYPGGENSPVVVPADSAVGAVFYRLAWP